MKGSQTITKEEIRRIYALGAAAGLLESGNREDALHCVVQRITGKESVSALTGAEFRAVQAELLEKLKLKNRTEPLDQRKRKQHEETPGGVTAEQQRKIWRLMYQLRDLDHTPSRATLGERLCGIIRKQLHRDCTPDQPFRFLSLADGWRLIEILKSIVGTAGKEAAASGGI